MITVERLLYVATWFVILGFCVGASAAPPVIAFPACLVLIGLGIFITAGIKAEFKDRQW